MISVILVLTGAAYALFILLSGIGWKKTKSFEEIQDVFHTHVSIIIPARNEEENILHCLNAIARQSYPKDFMEVIVADDGSEDRTAALVNDWIASNKLNAKIISPGGIKAGKKHALNEAVKRAAGELIVTTDADCTMGNHWLPTIVSYYEKYSPSMICGMVSVAKENNFLSAFQSLEQLGLTATGAAGIYFRHPVICSGANLAYPKKIFEEAGGYNLAAETASGDDTQLMFTIARHSPRSVHFIKSKETVVHTNPALTWEALITQRKRWGSKIFRQKNFTSVLSGLIVFLFHLFLVASCFLALSETVSWWVPFLLLCMKLVPETVLLGTMISFTGKKNLWQYIFISQLMYPFYLIVTGLLSQTGKYIWKNRSVR